MRWGQLSLSNCDVLGMLSATASLGLVLLWDVDSGLTQIDKYLYSSEDFIKVFICCCIYMYSSETMFGQWIFERPYVDLYLIMHLTFKE